MATPQFLAPLPVFACPDAEDITTIETSLMLDGKSPFKNRGRTTWTKLQRLAAGEASIAEDLEEFPAMV
jgi:hypothetical protein